MFAIINAHLIKKKTLYHILISEKYFYQKRHSLKKYSITNDNYDDQTSPFISINIYFFKIHVTRLRVCYIRLGKRTFFKLILFFYNITLKIKKKRNGYNSTYTHYLHKCTRTTYT